jgi:hypothetical protein
MNLSRTKLFFCLILLVFLSGFYPLAVQAQESMSKTHSVTGCLQKGVEPGGFTISGEDGTVWELSGKVDATHVGHKVTVSGHPLHRSEPEEAKFAANEKQEANGKQVADFQVTSFKMVSQSCQ